MTDDLISRKAALEACLTQKTKFADATKSDWERGNDSGVLGCTYGILALPAALEPPTHAAQLAAALAMPEVVALVETAQWARNRLNIIADESWHGDGRDLKRSIIGVFADFDASLLGCGSAMPEQFAALDAKESK